MKKLFVCLVLLLMPVVAMGFTDSYMNHTGEKTADGSIMAEPGYLYGLIVVTDGTNAVTMDIHDHASSTSGNKIVPTMVFAATPRVQSVSFDPPLYCMYGVYVNLTTSGTVAYMGYFRKE